MPTWFKSSAARSVAARALIPRWIRKLSQICAPTVCTGLSDVIGSWKITEATPPRTWRITRSGVPTSSYVLPSRAASRADPLIVQYGAGGVRPSSPRQVTLLPELVSPTSASVSPRRTEKLTSRTACTVPAAVRNATFRSRTSRMFSASAAA